MTSEPPKVLMEQRRNGRETDVTVISMLDDTANSSIFHAPRSILASLVPGTVCSMIGGFVFGYGSDKMPLLSLLLLLTALSFSLSGVLDARRSKAQRLTIGVLNGIATVGFMWLGWIAARDGFGAISPWLGLGPGGIVAGIDAVTAHTQIAIGRRVSSTTIGPSMVRILWNLISPLLLLAPLFVAIFAGKVTAMLKDEAVNGAFER